ncbi:MAG: NADP-dependent oxidoreductase [Hyphomonadaceae bacterium]|nr:NADP-dependent oxidoreductase [Hyphomonadaceae bacterium]
MSNRRWILKRRPVGGFKDGDLEFAEEAIPAPGEGEALVENLYLSIDPTHRIWMTDVAQYSTPVALGAVMRGYTIGRVLESKSETLKAGDIVFGRGDWQEYYRAKAKALTKVARQGDLPLHVHLGPLGNTGATAYFGLLDIGHPKPGETVLVSAAAGAVGSIVGQIAKIKGCRAVGLAGSEAKRRWLIDELGYDAALNYRDGNLLEAVRAACPHGIDIYFDNVGGEALEAALTLANLHARIVICGAISTYDDIVEASGPRMFRNVLMQRLRIEGFIVSDYWPRFPEAFAAIGGWIDEGRVKYRMDVRGPLAEAPNALKALFSGGNDGKLVVRVRDDQAD